jgi:hypothetical protein
MPTNTYVALDKVTVGTATNTISFSNIPATYTDLVVVISAPTTSDGATPQFRFNGDTTTNYSNTFLEGSGPSATSSRESNQTNIQLSYNVGGNSTNPSASIVHIMNYSNATTFKTLLARWNSASGGTYPGTAATVGLWRKTPEAISSMEIFVATGNFAAGSTFSLYGISAIGGATPKATGGDVYSDATYWYHAFRMSGNFVPNQSITADVLSVAGGGGGGGFVGGGGGAGGLLAFTSQSLTAQNYAVAVGGGGTGAGTAFSTRGGNGTNSQFGALTASVGGGGGGGYVDSGSTTPANGASGGSGGGATSSTFGQTFNGGAATSGQGNRGGNKTGTGTGGNGFGGGGAGAAGADATSAGSAGGIGVNTYSSWATATSTGDSGYFAGGGGGGVYSATQFDGGLGGGGRGGKADPMVVAVAGSSNTGGGGGGAGTGAAGGSGIVIVRYAK